MTLAHALVTRTHRAEIIQGCLVCRDEWLARMNAIQGWMCCRAGWPTTLACSQGQAVDRGQVFTRMHFAGTGAGQGQTVHQEGQAMAIVLFRDNRLTHMSGGRCIPMDDWLTALGRSQG